MSLENQVVRVAQGTKDTLKTLINKFGGNISDELIDQYPELVEELDINVDGAQADKGSPTLITIPMGWMAGDMNHDGKINNLDIYLLQSGTGSAGEKYYLKTFATLFPDGNIPLDYLAADVNGDGKTNSTDLNKLWSPTGPEKRDVAGNWATNPNMETDGFAFYTDITVSGADVSKDVILELNGVLSSDVICGGVVGDGYIRLYSNSLPVEAVDCAVCLLDGSGRLILNGLSTPKMKTTHFVEITSTAPVTLSMSSKDIFLALLNDEDVVITDSNTYCMMTPIYTFVDGIDKYSEAYFITYDWYEGHPYVLRVGLKQDSSRNLVDDNSFIYDFSIKGSLTVPADGFIVASSTEGSTKKFKITVDDSGTIAAVEV